MPDFSRTFTLYTDASNIAIGAVLSQHDDMGKEYVVAYASRILKHHERNYSAVEREGLSVINWVKHFRPYLHGTVFVLVTDHAALTYLFTQRDPTGRIARWAMQLQGFNFAIRHRPGSRHLNADSMTRPPVVSTAIEALALAVTVSDPTEDAIYKAQRNDKLIVKYIDYLEHSVLPSDTEEAKHIVNECRFFYVDSEDRRLYRVAFPHSQQPRLRRQLVVPLAMREEIMSFAHDDILGMHLGMDKTLGKLLPHYWWPSIINDVRNFVRSCAACQLRKSPRHGLHEELHPLPVTAVFDRLGLDILGPLNETKAGNKYIVVFGDYLTKWMEAFAVPDVTTERIAALFIEHIVSRYGTPRELLTDRGSQFTSQLFEKVTSILGVKKTFTTAYHPQTDGLVERFNATLVDLLTHFAGPNFDEWDLYLPLALAAYRRSPHASTGETPHFLMFGRDPVEPYHVAQQLPHNGDISVPEWLMGITRAWEAALTNIQKAQQRQKTAYDLRCKEVCFRPGDRVYLRLPTPEPAAARKFALPWHGPYRIVDVRGKGVYVIVNMADPSDKQTVNVARLKPAFDWLPLVAPSPTASAPSSDDVSPVATPQTSDSDASFITWSSPDDGHFEILAVVDSKMEDNKCWYKVRWAGFRGRRAFSWVKEEDLRASDLLADFKRRKEIQAARALRRKGR
jgi:hypothetical protein